MERSSDRAIEIIDQLHTERLGYESEYLPLIDCANKCSAYEDTGLEPEEISKIREDVENGYLKSTARRYGIPVDRLRELAEADREGKIPKYTIGDTVYDRFGDAWEVTAVELHSMRAKNEWLYRCGHNGTDDYCALWHFEAFPNKESALRREQDG